MILDDANYKDFLKEVVANNIVDVKLGYSFVEIELSNGKTFKVESTNNKTNKRHEFNDIKLILE